MRTRPISRSYSTRSICISSKRRLKYWSGLILCLRRLHTSGSMPVRETKTMSSDGVRSGSWYPQYCHLDVDSDVFGLRPLSIQDRETSYLRKPFLQFTRQMTEDEIKPEEVRRKTDPSRYFRNAERKERSILKTDITRGQLVPVVFRLAAASFPVSPSR